MIRLILTTATVVCATCALASDKADAPQAGTYAATFYVRNADYGCLDTSGSPRFASVSFSGLGGSKHYIRIPIATSAVAIASVRTLTVTGGKGTTQLSGSLSWTAGGVGNGWNVSGTFKAMITEIGTHAFAIQMMESYTGCNEEDSVISLVRTGVDQ